MRRCFLRRVHLVQVALGLLACGRPVSPGEQPDGGASLLRPQLLGAAPRALAVGQTLTLTGQNFATAATSQVLLQFAGTYQDSAGRRHKVDYQTATRVDSSTRLSWRLWPGIVFHPQGNLTGRFVGTVVATNRSPGGSPVASNALPLELRIASSIVLRRSRPRSSGCAQVVGNTHEGQSWTFAAEAVGLRPGTKDRPLTFHWQLSTDQWEIVWTTPGSRIIPAGARLTLAQVVRAGSSTTLSGGSQSYRVSVGSDLAGDQALTDLRTGTIPSGKQKLPLVVKLRASDADNKTASITIDLVLRPPAEVDYRGDAVIVERSRPKMITSCIPGPREVSYTPSTQQSWQRSYSLELVTGGVCTSFPNPCDLSGLGPGEILHAFGLSGWKVSPKDRPLSGTIGAGQVGAVYFQVLKLRRRARVLIHNICGSYSHGADLLLTDWAFTSELAAGPGCPPPSTLGKNP